MIDTHNITDTLITDIADTRYIIDTLHNRHYITDTHTTQQTEQRVWNGVCNASITALTETT